jgi:hypothetical protein
MQVLRRHPLAAMASLLHVRNHLQQALATVAAVQVSTNAVLPAAQHSTVCHTSGHAITPAQPLQVAAAEDPGPVSPQYSQ